MKRKNIWQLIILISMLFSCRRDQEIQFKQGMVDDRIRLIEFKFVPIHDGVTTFDNSPLTIQERDTLISMISKRRNSNFALDDVGRVYVNAKFYENVTFMQSEGIKIERLISASEKKK